MTREQADRLLAAITRRYQRQADALDRSASDRPGRSAAPPPRTREKDFVPKTDEEIEHQLFAFMGTAPRGIRVATE